MSTHRASRGHSHSSRVTLTGTNRSLLVRSTARHELFYPCCNSGISESGCMSSEHHTPDTTDDDCLTGFVETRNPPPGERGSRKIFSLDCEMCCTTAGTELTRVTVIGHDCETVYDSLVKPRNPILDYCTKWVDHSPVHFWW